jgi:hypothetical protein
VHFFIFSLHLLFFPLQLLLGGRSSRVAGTASRWREGRRIGGEEHGAQPWRGSGGRQQQRRRRARGSDDKLVACSGVKFGDTGHVRRQRSAHVPFPPPRPSHHAPRPRLVDGGAQGGKQRRAQGCNGKLVGSGGIEFRGRGGDLGDGECRSLLETSGVYHVRPTCLRSRLCACEEKAAGDSLKTQNLPVLCAQRKALHEA